MWDLTHLPRPSLTSILLVSFSPDFSLNRRLALCEGPGCCLDPGPAPNVKSSENQINGIAEYLYPRLSKNWWCFVSQGNVSNSENLWPLRAIDHYLSSDWSASHLGSPSLGPGSLRPGNWGSNRVTSWGRGGRRSCKQKSVFKVSNKGVWIYSMSVCLSQCCQKQIEYIF